MEHTFSLKPEELPITKAACKTPQQQQMVRAMFTCMVKNKEGKYRMENDEPPYRNLIPIPIAFGEKLDLGDCYFFQSLLCSVSLNFF